MAVNPRDAFFERPSGMCLHILFFGWTAASGGSPTWARVLAAALVMERVAALARYLVRRRRARRGTAAGPEADPVG
ncbi:hypothetical protein [Streptomyces sp. NPDC014734]|uniref:hypothetical protein n=1 Tax=Streptomyces sp. NPDC014734 TaxID=3364886 RepID=UPI003701FCD0